MPARRPPWQSRAPAAPFLLLVLPHNTATTHPERQTGRRWTPLCGFAAGASNAVAAWGTIRTGAEIAPSTERTTQCVVGRQLRSPPLCGPANATVPAPAWRLPRCRSVGGLPGKPVGAHSGWLDQNRAHRRGAVVRSRKHNRELARRLMAARLPNAKARQGHAPIGRELERLSIGRGRTRAVRRERVRSKGPAGCSKRTKGALAHSIHQRRTACPDPTRIRRQIACWPPQTSLVRSVEEAGARDRVEGARSGVRQTRR
jgi:hypothetical protein